MCILLGKIPKNLLEDNLVIFMLKALPDKDAKKMEKHMFRLYDANDDGTIDFVEFMVFVDWINQ